MELLIEGVKVDTSGKKRCTVQDGEREYLLEVNNETESWIDQVRHKYEPREYERRKAIPEYEGRKTSPDASIYRVPEFLKKKKRDAYDPQVVFLGPFHHKKHQKLTAMDEYKLHAVDKTLQRLPNTTMVNLVEKVKELDERIRVCYEESAFEWDKDTLSWIMTIDACFILEFLRMDLPDSNLVFHFQRGDNIKRREIMLEILKLENQIPLCILEKILQLELKDSAAVRVFLAQKLNRCMSLYFQGFPFEVNDDNEKGIAKLIERGTFHLLDLSRKVIAGFLSNSDCGLDNAIPIQCCACNVRCGSSCFGGTSWTDVSRPSLRGEGISIPSAERLRKAGITLKPSDEGNFHFKPRCLRRSILFVPQITVSDETEVFLRNLLAFEECQMHDNSPIERVISSCMWIMDNLIDSEEDVKLLEDADIVQNYLGTKDEVAKIFNDLCIGITYQGDFAEVSKSVNDHYNRTLKVWISEFWETYCSRPWYIISLVAAVALLVMTFLQTMYTMKSYFHSS